ncbi:bifunctional biotin--[acetyl-CoA-carboxylase] ligase/biotin operon repressor BirA [Pseudomonas sp. PS1]|uniref:Bifunctional ligase/repressor BirA n=1 Tax=Stutzerimonas marianensis TaxID=2929513 RepID=A0A9X2ATU9_9GAMM|nr:bifunctional biotin--[acetyl-CoA-carboxylase] ligase/biotin operon repressor BirA [Pseudomonas marianensis]MCJ0976038.1 bifunctional biotin--[acetyl-CoA-carboxylase] ligase/biotin operon repressor BirA [Pseudomonas marianensis]
MNNLLALLADGRFHSGEELGASLGVSRSAVWKGLKRLEGELGIPLFRVPGKGYRLPEPISLLDGQRLQDCFDRRGWRLHLAECVGSTNAEALRLIAQGDPPPFVVIAEMQSSGRGRRGREWVSPPCQNVYFSLALRVCSGAEGLSGLSLVVGLAVLDALVRVGVQHVGLKWPNDVYIGDQKVAGILLELTGDLADVCFVVIGIGINVNMVASEGRISQSWTSVRESLGQSLDRNTLISILSESLDVYLRRHKDEGFVGLRDEWESKHIWQSRFCILSAGVRPVKGKVLGVDERGALRMEVDGGEQRFSGGELSLRLDHDS